MNNTAEVDRETLRIVAADGYPLAAMLFRPADRPEGARTAIFLCATGATQARFAPFARHLAAHGWNVLTFDYRGIGASRPEQDHPDYIAPSMRAWGQEDLTAMIDWAGKRFPAAPIALVGHSIGGQIVPLARNAYQVRAMLAVAVQKGWYRLWPDWRRYVVYAYFRLYIPLTLRLFDRVPMGFAGLDDLAPGIARDYARWTLSPDYMDQSGASLHDAFARFRAPILSLSFEDDRNYAPRAAVDRLFEAFYVSAPVWRAHIDPDSSGMPALGHSGFFDPRLCPEEYWQDAERWMRNTVDGETSQPFDALPATRLQRKDADVSARRTDPDAEHADAL